MRALTITLGAPEILAAGDMAWLSSSVNAIGKSLTCLRKIASGIPLPSGVRASTNTVSSGLARLASDAARVTTPLTDADGTDGTDDTDEVDDAAEVDHAGEASDARGPSDSSVASAAVALPDAPLSGADFPDAAGVAAGRPASCLASTRLVCTCLT